MYAVGGDLGERRWSVRERDVEWTSHEGARISSPALGEVSAETPGTGHAGDDQEGANHAGAAHAGDAAALDPDDLYQLGERCAETYMQADALQYEAMVLLAEYDAREGWRDTGFGGTAEWLAWRVGIKLHTAKDRLRVALALQNLPLTSAAMANGELSYSKVRGMARWARAESEAALLELAQSTSAARFEKECRAIKQLDRGKELNAAQVRHRNRRFSVFPDDDGMYVVTGRLDPEVGALLMRTLEAAEDALFRAAKSQGADRDGADRDGADPDVAHPDVAEASPVDPQRPKPEQRRADALALVAERAMAAGFRNDGKISGAKAERYQVTLYVDADTLSEDGEPGRSELGDGTRVSAETARRLCCDAAVTQMEHGGDGRIVSVSHRHRTIPPSLRRALEARDRGCRFPACGVRFTDGHHLKHWANGGGHTLRNTLLLCFRHHRAVHEGQVRVALNHEGVAVFYAPNGTVMMSVPPGRTGASPRWTSPDGRSPRGAPPRGAPRSPRRPLDEAAREMLPWHKKGAARYSDADLPLHVLGRAREAL